MQTETNEHGLNATGVFFRVLLFYSWNEINFEFSVGRLDSVDQMISIKCINKGAVFYKLGLVSMKRKHLVSCERGP